RPAMGDRIGHVRDQRAIEGARAARIEQSGYSAHEDSIGGFGIILLWQYPDRIARPAPASWQRYSFSRTGCRFRPTRATRYAPITFSSISHRGIGYGWAPAPTTRPICGICPWPARVMPMSISARRGVSA